MAIALRGAVQQANGASAGSGNVTLNAPAGLASNDEFSLTCMAATSITSDAQLTDFQAPWADGTGIKHAAARRLCNGSETSFVETCVGGSLAIGFAVSGVNTSTPTEQFTKNDPNGTTTFTTTASTPTDDNSWHVVGYHDGNNTNTVATPPAGYTILGARQDNGAVGTGVMYRKDLGAGSAGTPVTATLVWTSNAWGTAISYIIRPSLAGSDTLMGGGCL